MPHGPPSVLLTEDGSNEAVMSAANLGYDPNGVYSQHTVSAGNLGGGTWQIHGLGPSGAYTSIVTGLTLEIASLGPRQAFVAGQELPRGPWSGWKAVFVGTAGPGDPGELYVQSEAP